jgi:hypothetical protein
MPAVQKPYVPFENDRVSWLEPQSEAAAPAVSRKGGTKPSLLLFLSHEDGEKCMARNFERSVFRDAAVVNLAKDAFLCVRIDRTSSLCEPFALNGPELIIQDGEGDEIARFIECTDSAFVFEIMKEAIARCRETAKKGAEHAPRLARVEKLMSDGQTRDASAIVAKAKKEPRLSKFLREKVANLEQGLCDLAAPRLAEASAKDAAGDTPTAWKLYREVRDDFEGTTPSQQAKDALVALGKVPEKRAKLREAQAQDDLDAARALVEKGSRGQATLELRRIAGVYADTPVAEEAKKLLAELAASGK